VFVDDIILINPSIISSIHRSSAVIVSYGLNPSSSMHACYYRCTYYSSIPSPPRSS